VYFYNGDYDLGNESQKEAEMLSSSFDTSENLPDISTHHRFLHAENLKRFNSMTNNMNKRSKFSVSQVKPNLISACLTDYRHYTISIRPIPPVQQVSSYYKITLDPSQPVQ
jgi:hypothetical protein